MRVKIRVRARIRVRVHPNRMKVPTGPCSATVVHIFES